MKKVKEIKMKWNEIPIKEFIKGMDKIIAMLLEIKPCTK